MENFIKEDLLFPNEEELEIVPDSFVEPKEWTIITALNRIVTKVKVSGLSDQFWLDCKTPFDFLTEKLEMTKGEVLILAVLVELGEVVSWSKMAKFLKTTRISAMTYTDDMDALIRKRWVTYEMGGSYDGVSLVYGVTKALRHNQPFVPEKIDGLTLQELVDKMERRKVIDFSCFKCDFSESEQWYQLMCESNKHLPICQKALEFDDIHVLALLFLTVVDFGEFAESDGEGLCMATIEDFFSDIMNVSRLKSSLRDGSHPLIKEGMIEHKCEDGMANVERYALTQQFKNIYLKGYVPSKSQCEENNYNYGLKKPSAIVKKEMFYNPKETSQIKRLSSLLQEENLRSIQERMEKEGMRKGFACLFYGAPGTGKTETVLQLARETGRDIMQIDIAGMRDKFVGESEKNIKAVFSRYKEICRNTEKLPILFFNEADALFNKRTEHIQQAVDRMDNAMQNIILQEMENLDGILIATTNLTSNLDSAFERRFLFKVEFQKPDKNVKAQLWSSMLHSLSEEEAQKLASQYDFSGGQIENIARKRTIEYILSGKEQTMQEIMEFCQNELLDVKKRPTVGFGRE